MDNSMMFKEIEKQLDQCLKGNETGIRNIILDFLISCWRCDNNYIKNNDKFLDIYIYDTSYFTCCDDCLKSICCQGCKNLECEKQDKSFCPECYIYRCNECFILCHDCECSVCSTCYDKDFCFYEHSYDVTKELLLLYYEKQSLHNENRILRNDRFSLCNECINLCHDYESSLCDSQLVSYFHHRHNVKERINSLHNENRLLRDKNQSLRICNKLKKK